MAGMNKNDLIKTRRELEAQAKRENWKMQEFTDAQVENHHYRNDIDNHYNKKYDFYTLNGIESIPNEPYVYFPFPDDGCGIASPVGNIEYVLNMKAGMHATNKRMDLAIACLRKSRSISAVCKYNFYEFDMRLVIYLLIDGQFDEARKEWDKIVYRTRFSPYRRPEFIEQCSEAWFEKEKKRAIIRLQYQRIQKLLPDVAPKSFSGYMRMKNSNSKSWVKLVAAAKEIEIELENECIMYKSEAYQTVEILINELNAAFMVITTTNIPSQYFHYCLVIVGLCNDLKRNEASIRFTKYTPDEVLQKFWDEKEQLTRDFLKRFCDNAIYCANCFSDREKVLREGRKHITQIEPFLDELSKEDELYFIERMREIFGEPDENDY